MAPRTFQDEKTVVEFGEEPQRPGGLTYFVCLTCGATFAVSDSIYLDEPFTRACETCGQAISIRTTQAQSSMQVLELYGCEYGFLSREPGLAFLPASPVSENQILNWIEESTADQKTRIDASPFEGQSTFLDGLIARWVVNAETGQKMEFEYFSALRKAIEDGVIEGTDRIEAPDGQRWHVQTYPGTADLFGRSSIQRAAKARILERATPAKRAARFLKTAGKWALLGVTAFGLSSFVFFGNKYLERWKLFQGSLFVGRLADQVKLAPTDTLEGVLREAGELNRRKSPETLPQLVGLYEKALALHRSSPQIIGRLAENLVEMALLTADSADLDRARKLIDYANVLNPGQVEATRAQARLLAKRGQPTEAISLLEAQPDRFLTDPENGYLFARIALEAGDFVKAGLKLNELVTTHPDNVSYLVTFSELFERQGKFDQAASFLRRARIASDRPGIFTEKLAQLYEKGSDVDSAAQIRREAVRQGENAEQNLFALVKLFSSKDRHQEARAESLNYLSQFHGSAREDDVQKIYRTTLAALDPVKSQPPVTKGEKEKVRKARRSALKTARR